MTRSVSPDPWASLWTRKVLAIDPRYPKGWPCIEVRPPHALSCTFPGNRTSRASGPLPPYALNPLSDQLIRRLLHSHLIVSICVFRGLLKWTNEGKRLWGWGSHSTPNSLQPLESCSSYDNQQSSVVRHP
jgi:hypothetical protein